MRKMRIILFSVIYALIAICVAQRRPPNFSLDEMPRTSFSCRDKIVGGYYADPETDCQMFHVCVRVAGLGVQDFRFLCPNDTSFDQENQICDDWYNIDCEASTLYYSDNFDLYRIADGVPEFGPSRATPIPLGPSSIAPQPYSKPKQRPHKPVNNAVSDDDDDSYLFKADSGDRRLQKDLLRGSSSGNFFANKNQGKEDEYDDLTLQDPTKNQLNTQSKKKQNKGVVRKLLTGKRPLQNQEVSTTTTTIVPNPFNNVGARNKYNTVQRNRQTTPVPTESTANNYYQSTAAAVNNYNNYNARNNYNTNGFNNYQTSSTTIAPLSGTYTNPQSSGVYNNFKSRGNVNYNTYTNKQPETTINYYNQQQSTTVPPVQNYNNNNNYNQYNNNYNANQYQTTSTANPFNNYYQSTNSETTKFQNYQPSTTTNQNNYYQQTPSTVNYNQQYNNYNNQQYNKSPSTDAYQQPTTVKPYNNNNYYQQQTTTTVKPTVNNNYYSQQNYNNLNNQQSSSSTYNYDYYYQTSTTASPPNYPSYYTTQATPFVNNYDQGSSTTQNSNYQTINLYNYNLNAANTAAVAQASATNAAASFTNSQQNYDPYNSYHNNNNDKYDEPSYGESLKTAPSSNIKPSDINSLNQQTYQSQKIQNKLQTNNGFNTTVSTSYNFNTETQKTQQPTSQKYQTTKSFQTTPKPNYYTVAVPTSKAINRNTQIVQQNNYQNQYVSSSTQSAINRGNNFYATASSNAPIKPESKKTITAQQSTTVKSTSTNSGASKKEKDTSYDYAYYDDGSPSEYDAFDPVGEEFSRTHSKKAKRGVAKHK